MSAQSAEDGRDRVVLSGGKHPRTGLHLTAYIRVSTAEQVDGQGLDIQRDTISAWARTHGHTITAWHADEGISGSNGLETRAGLAAALDTPDDGIVVSRLDRLARDLIVQEQILADVWRRGRSVHSTADSESACLSDDPSDPSRKLVRQVLGAVSEYERAMIRLRMQSGRARKAAGGGYAFGAPPYGYAAVGGVLHPVPDEQATLARIRELRAQGVSLQAIADTLTGEGHSPRRGARWAVSSVRKITARL